MSHWAFILSHFDTSSLTKAVIYRYTVTRELEEMQGETKERWQKLCAQAATETDHDKLLRLIEEINRLLCAKEKRLQNQANDSDAT